jgi:hypothetical protein
MTAGSATPPRLLTIRAAVLFAVAIATGVGTFILMRKDSASVPKSIIVSVGTAAVRQG